MAPGRHADLIGDYGIVSIGTDRSRTPERLSAANRIENATRFSLRDSDILNTGQDCPCLECRPMKLSCQPGKHG